MTISARPYGGPFVAVPRRWGRPAVIAGMLAGVRSLGWGLWLGRDAGGVAAQ